MGAGSVVARVGAGRLQGAYRPFSQISNRTRLRPSSPGKCSLQAARDALCATSATGTTTDSQNAAKSVGCSRVTRSMVPSRCSQRRTACQRAGLVSRRTYDNPGREAPATMCTRSSRRASVPPLRRGNDRVSAICGSRVRTATMRAESSPSRAGTVGGGWLFALTGTSPRRMATRLTDIIR